MDARINDAPPSNVQVLEVVEERSSRTYNLDVEALNRLIDFGREHNPRLKGASEARIADLCEISETTYKSIRKGRNRKPRVDILYSIVALFGGSIDRLIGLAPTRDLSRERAVWDATLVDGYLNRIDDLEKQIIAKDSELDRLRKRVLAESTARASAEARVSELNERCLLRRSELAELRTEHRKSKRLNIILTAVLFVILAAYIIFEATHPDIGITAALARLAGLL